MTNKYILKLACDDTKGIVAKVSGFLFDMGGFIIQSAQFGDSSTGKFFMRTEFSCDKNISEIETSFKVTASNFGMEYSFTDTNIPAKTLIAVTKENHCLLNLIQKNRIGALDTEIVGVISNREDLRSTVEQEGLDFHFLPIENDKKSQEQKILELFSEKQADLLVLARYMQVLSDETCKILEGKAINIHHSFLPGFKGAKPYHQAYDRGVKIIGATAHYVTNELDEGPIIEQEVIRVDHSFSPEDLKIAGQDIESRVLYNAVKWHLEQRIILNGNKTVIFK